MRTVKVRMRASDLAHQMAAMREWLDRHRYVPARFVYDQDGDAVDISVEFPDDHEGEAFARYFDGREPQQAPPNHLLRQDTGLPFSGRQSSLPLTGTGPDREPAR